MGIESSNGASTRALSPAHQDGAKERYDGADTSLLPGLPNDIALQCLVRVPRRCHSRLASVCKQWKEVLLSKEYYFLRRELCLTEGWIYALSRDSSELLHWFVMDPMERRWKELPPMPGDWAKRFGLTSEVLNRELFVLGGLKKFRNPSSEVVKYDPVTNRWIEVPKMETARCYFVCAAFDGQLYAVGGMGTRTGALNSWEVFDAGTQSWSFFEDENIIADIGESLVLDRKLYIRHICPSDTSVYNPAENTWAPVHNEMTENWIGPTTAAGNEMYMLDQTNGVKLMLLDKGTLSWNSVGRLAPVSVQPPCGLAVVGRTLYLVGKGLRTIAIDMDRAGDSSGFLVTSSFPGPTCWDGNASNGGSASGSGDKEGAARLSDVISMTLSCHVIEV